LANNEVASLLVGQVEAAGNPFLGSRSVQHGWEQLPFDGLAGSLDMENWKILDSRFGFAELGKSHGTIGGTEVDSDSVFGVSHCR
jgi:hypothetical protein